MFVLGAVWFMLLFGRAYAFALGRENAPPAKPAPIFIIGPLICSGVSTIASALLIKALGITTIGDAIVFGLLVGVGYIVATMTNVAINPNMPRPLTYSLVNGPYFLLGSVATSVILVAMG